MRLIVLMPMLLIACEPPAPAPERPPERTVTADDLMRAWTSNQPAARRDFGDTPIRITGTIATVTDNGMLLDTFAGPSVGLQITAAHRPALANLKPGAPYSADCEGTVRFEGLVVARDCRPSPPAS